MYIVDATNRAYEIVMILLFVRTITRAYEVVMLNVGSTTRAYEV